MTSMELLETFGGIRDQYVLAAHEERKKARLSLKRTWLMAAIIALMLLLVGCVAVILGLQDLKIGEFLYQNGGGTGELISLEGYVGSPGYQANQEWRDFLDSYDQDQNLADYDDYIVPEEYQGYYVYTEEMVKKLEDICEKYDLKLDKKCYMNADYTEIVDAVGAGSLYAEGAAIETHPYAGMYYANGSFYYSAETTMTGEDTPWAYPVSYEYLCSMKDTFGESSLNVGDIESYQQWNYTTKDGTQVLLALSAEKALILVDNDSCFLSVNILNPRIGDVVSGEQQMDASALEAFADCFDFSYTPQAVNVELADQREAARQAAFDARVEEVQLREHRDNYKDYIFDYRSTDENVGFCLLDFDGNGVEELAYSYSGEFMSLYTIADGYVQEYPWFGFTGGYVIYQAQDGEYVLLTEKEVGHQTYCAILRVEGTDLVFDAYLKHDPVAGTESTWFLCTNARGQEAQSFFGGPMYWENLSQTELEAIWDSYEYQNPAKQPITDLLPEGAANPNERYDGEYGYLDNGDGTVTLTRYVGKETKLTIPMFLGGKPVSVIGNTFGLKSEANGEGAFQGNNNIKSVIIPASVTKIDDNAFQSCHSLETVTIPETVTAIGHCVFEDCVNLKSVYFLGNAPSLGNYVFTGANQMTVYYREGTKGWTAPEYGSNSPWKNLNVVSAQSGSDSVIGEDTRRQIMAKFVGIMLESDTFYTRDDNREMTIAEYCKAFGEASGITVTVPKFAVVDMDGDGVNEIVLWLLVNGNNDYGTLVLRYQNGTVYGTSFSYRQLYHLRKDGTFDYSGGADNDGMAVLKFTEFDAYSEEVNIRARDKASLARWHSYPCQQIHGLLQSYEYAKITPDSAAIGAYYYYGVFHHLAGGYSPEQCSWSGMKDWMLQDGYVVKESEGIRTVYFPDIPGSWIYAYPAENNAIGELGYYICTEDGEYEVKITELNTGNPRYYTEVKFLDDGKAVSSMEEMNAYMDAVNQLSPETEQDREQITRIIDHFPSACFTENREGMKEFLADGVDTHKEIDPDAQYWQYVRWLGLPEEETSVGQTVTVWLECRESENSGKLHYFAMELIKQEDGWKVLDYWVEQ